MYTPAKEYKGYESIPIYEGYIGDTNISENYGYSKFSEHLNMSAALLSERRGCNNLNSLISFWCPLPFLESIFVQS